MNLVLTQVVENNVVSHRHPMGCLASDIQCPVRWDDFIIGRCLPEKFKDCLSQVELQNEGICDILCLLWTGCLKCADESQTRQNIL